MPTVHLVQFHHTIQLVLATSDCPAVPSVPAATRSQCYPAHSITQSNWSVPPVITQLYPQYQLPQGPSATQHWTHSCPTRVCVHHPVSLSHTSTLCSNSWPPMNSSSPATPPSHPFIARAPWALVVCRGSFRGPNTLTGVIINLWKQMD